jgi:hypothetical protein
MKSKKINKELVIKSVMKMIADKELVRSYLHGKTSLEKLNENGIKIAKPL